MKEKKGKRLMILTTGTLVILVGAWFWYSGGGATASQSWDGDIHAIDADDITKGNPKAKAVLIEYGDFQCIACKHMHERFRLIWRVVKDDLYLVYRHYPLGQHAHARMAARYSEAMKRQGKFWEFHDLVYDHQQDWEVLSAGEAEKMFQDFVTQAQGDLAQVKKDLEDPAIEDKIDKDMKRGDLSGLAGTPTLILNGNKIDIPTDLGKFVSQIKKLNLLGN